MALALRLAAMPEPLLTRLVRVELRLLQLFCEDDARATRTVGLDDLYLRGLVVNVPHPNLAIGLSKKLVDPSNLDLIVLETSNLEPLLDFLGGLGFPTLQAGPIDGLVWVPWLVALLLFGPPHVAAPPGVEVFVPLVLRWVISLVLEGLVPSPVLRFRFCSFCLGLDDWGPFSPLSFSGCLYYFPFVRGNCPAYLLLRFKVNGLFHLREGERQKSKIKKPKSLMKSKLVRRNSIRSNNVQ